MKRITAFIVSLCMSVGLPAPRAPANDGVTDAGNGIIVKI